MVKKSSSPKPIWQNGFVIFLLLSVFPVGLYLMWKYADWPKWLKVVLSVIAISSVVSFLYGWNILYGGRPLENLINPPVLNKSETYDCHRLKLEWGECRDEATSISIEYPQNWNYAEGTQLKVIKFSPLTNVLERPLITLTKDIFETDKKALEFTKGTNNSNETIPSVSGLLTTKVVVTMKIGKLAGKTSEVYILIQKGNIVYTFAAWPYWLHRQNFSVTEAELMEIFNHMVNSFKVEQ